MVKGAPGEAEDFGKSFPFSVPVAEAALMLLRHGGEHGADERRNAQSGGENDGAGNGIALVGEGGRTAAAGGGGFEHFSNFGLGVKGNVSGDLAEGANQQAEGG